MKTLAMLAGAAILSCALPAAARMDGQADGNTPPSSPCQARPDRNDDNGSQTGNRQPPPGDLTKKLDPCDGVLKPPPTGDDDMTKPAPDEGNTPVVRPDEVPQQ